MNNNWDFVRTLHSTLTHTPPHVVDLIAVDELLYLYATGLGVSDIAQALTFDEQYVESTLSTYYSNFSRTDTLSYNPMKYYESCFGDLDLYIITCYPFSPEEDELIESYLTCKFYKLYKKEIEKYEGS